MNQGYDVIVAGAGPAGAQAARDIADRGYDVLVLERESESGFPQQSNKSTGGTFPSMMAAFGIPDDVVMQFTDSVVLESPQEFYAADQPGAVLDFAAFKQFLVEDSRDRGADYEFGAHVSGPIVEDGDVVGVQYNGNEEVRGSIVIDATGPAAALAEDLDVVDLDRQNQAIGVEQEFTGVELNHPGYADLREAMMLRLDSDLAPGGYAWIFHTGADTAKVGVTYIQNDRFREEAVDRTIDGFLEHWREVDPRLADAEPIPDTQHRGSAHIQSPQALSTDSFMAIGDTVPTIDPLWGEGIHKGMQSGRMAAITADHALTPTEPDTSAETMATYDELWHERVAPNMDRRLLMTKLLYFAPDDRYDQFLADLNRLDVETLAAANEGSPRALAKLFHLDDLSLLTQFAREEITAGS